MPGRTLAGVDTEEQIRDYSTSYLLAVYFRDAAHGWAFGGDGNLLSTSDGGRKWSRRKLATPKIGFLSAQIGFQNAQEGWIAAEDQFFKTNDAGRTWRRSAPPVPGAYWLYFVTPQTGWLFSLPNRIFKTGDGGRTWREQLLKSDKKPLDVGCFSERECIVVGENGSVSTTFDGSHWNKRETDAGGDIDRIQVTRDGTAWASVRGYNDGYVLHSPDKGRSWVSTRLSIHPYHLIFWGDRKGLVAGHWGIVWTEDAGGSWHEVDFPGGYPSVQCFHFLDDKQGWAVGGLKTILHTKDGGKTWVKQYGE